jgi:DNA repair protein RecN (Recombination protein N)
MLQALRIRNFAIIDVLELDFSRGFTVITGETGSGKSILLNALNLLLGERSNTSVIGNNGEKAVVEGDFVIDDFMLKSFFLENDLDYEDKTVIRREINKNGKSRAFVNDTPVNLSVLSALTSRLINIHSQYNTLELKEKRFQLEILDTLALLDSEKIVYNKLFENYKIKKSALKEKKDLLQNLNLKKDYVTFQLDELNALKLLETDYLAIEQKIKVLENRENILSVLQQLIMHLNDEPAIISNLTHIKNRLIKEAEGSPKLAEFSESLTSTIVDLKELLNEVIAYTESLDFNHENIEEYIQQIDAFQHCLRKHGAHEQQELIQLWKAYQEEVFNADTLHESIEAIQIEIALIESELATKAEILHNKRIQAAKIIESEVQQLLSDLKLSNTQFIFDLNRSQELNATGLTQVQMLFSANRGIPAVPIEKAASGGELSRVMLGLQKLLAEKKQLPTVIFDEIDTGVSGDVAQKIGNLLQDMGVNVQLVAITHLPQVAAKASSHLRVLKQNIEDQTKVVVKELIMDERIEEIARLMSGEKITEAAIENAKHLMS